MGFAELRVQDVLGHGRSRDRDREKSGAALPGEGAELRKWEGFQGPREEEPLVRRLEVCPRGMHERRHLLHADSARDVPVRVHGIDDHEGFRERPSGRTIELEDGRGPPGEAVLQDPSEGAVLQDEEFAQVSAEAEDLRLGPVDADALRPRLQEAHVVLLAFLHMAEDVIHVERGAIDGAHALRRVRDPVARDDLDFEPAVPSARVRMLRVHPHGPLEYVAEGEPFPLQDLARRVGRKGDEDVDLGAGEVDALRDGTDEQRFRPQALRGDLPLKDLHHVADHALDASVLLRRGQDFPKDLLLERRHRRPNPLAVFRIPPGGTPRSIHRAYRMRPFIWAAATMPSIRNCTAIAARRRPITRPMARVPVRPILRKIRSALWRRTKADRTATRMPAKTNSLSVASETGAVM